MTNELQTFDFEGQDLAIKEINGEVYFNAEQAAIGLGISEIAKSGNVVVKWVRVNKYLGIDTSVDGKIKRGDYITEPQFYKLAIKANNPVAERFQDWVTSEVLPAIRKHGAYMTDRKAYDITHDKSGTALADLLQQAADQLKQKDIQIEEIKPKAEYFDSQMRNPGLMTATEIAKDYGWSARNLNKELSKRHIIFKQGKHWVLYQEYADKGYAQYEPYDCQKNGAQRGVSNNLKWTQKGKKFIYDLLAQDGIRPLTEQIDSVEDDALPLIERR